MKAYLSFFRIRFLGGIQYRSAAAAGIATQLAWGGLYVLLYKAFYEANPAAFPMTLSQSVDYSWLRQAFLTILFVWIVDGEILSAIVNGEVAYEMVRPTDLYTMWFTKNVATRLSRLVLRCGPVLLVAFLLPPPYGLSLPVSVGAFAAFLVTTALAMGNAVAYVMLLYVFSFFTVSPMGLRMLMMSLTEFLAGGIVPLPFMPPVLQKILAFSPFGAMMNVPLRVYSGHIAGQELWISMALQVFWLIAMVLMGRGFMRRACRKLQIQGG